MENIRVVLKTVYYIFAAVSAENIEVEHHYFLHLPCSDLNA